VNLGDRLAMPEEDHGLSPLDVIEE